MKFIKSLLIATSLMALATACNDDDPTGPDKGQQANEITASDWSLGGLEMIEPDWNWTAKIIRVDGTVFDCKLLVQGTYYESYPLYKGDTVEVDFYEPETITNMTFMFANDNVALTEIKNVQTSTDGKNWDNWGDVKLGDNYRWYLSFSKPVTLRYLRFIAGDYTNNKGWECEFVSIDFYR